MLTDEEQTTLNTYNSIATDWVTKHYNLDFWADEYKTFYGFLPKGKIIDLGCGGGRDSVWFESNGYDYTGVDISEGMIAEANKRHPNTKFLRQSLYELDFPKKSFDGFWSSCSFLHIPKSRLTSILDNIKQILKPGAIGFISIKQGDGTANIQSRQTAKSRVFTYYEREEFAKILSANGFEILKTAARPPGRFSQNETFLIFYVRLTK